MTRSRIKPKHDLFRQQASELSLIRLHGKVPIEREWQQFCHHRRSYDEIGFQPEENAGIACGPASNCVAVDVDNEELFESVCGRHELNIPETRMHKTGSGRPHILFQYPADGKAYGNKAFKTLGFDVRGDGGQIVAPGSIHPETGQPYTVSNEASMAQPPQWLLGLYTKDRNDWGAIKIESLPIPDDVKRLMREDIPKGQRSEPMWRVLRTLVRAGLSDDQIFFVFYMFEIGGKFRKIRNNRDRWLQQQIDKAKAQQRSHQNLTDPPEGIDNLMKDIAGATIIDLNALLGRIVAIRSAAVQETMISKLAQRLRVTKGALKEDLQQLVEPGRECAVAENVLIAHPSYEVNQDFLSLGFRETIVQGGKDQARNFYVVSGKGSLHRFHEHLIDLEGHTVIFQERDRTLVHLQDRWPIANFHDFITNPVPPEGVYDKVKRVIQEYVEFQRFGQYGLLTSWVMATYFHRLFNAMPFLSVYGRKQSGKSRVLDILERLAFHAFKTKGISVASLADSLDGVRGTLLIDQAESLADKMNIELLGILADSYTPGGGRRRIVNITPKGRRLIEFETYAPKAFASIKELDEDLRDRCILFPMLRARREYPYPEPWLTVWGKVRSLLYRLLLTRWEELREIYPHAGQGMKQRVRELWKPLDSILVLSCVPNDEHSEVRDAFIRGVSETQAELSDNEERLFQALLNLLHGRSERVLTCKDIAVAMQDDGDLFKSEKAKTTWIGKQIRKLSLSEAKLNKDAKGQHRYLFKAEHVRDIYERYQTGAGGGEVVESEAGQHFLGRPPLEVQPPEVPFPDTLAPFAATTQPPWENDDPEVLGENKNDYDDFNHLTTSTTCLPKQQNAGISFEEF